MIPVRTLSYRGGGGAPFLPSEAPSLKSSKKKNVSEKLPHCDEVPDTYRAQHKTTAVVEHVGCVTIGGR